MLARPGVYVSTLYRGNGHGIRNGNASKGGNGNGDWNGNEKEKGERGVKKKLGNPPYYDRSRVKT